MQAGHDGRAGEAQGRGGRGLAGGGMVKVDGQRRPRRSRRSPSIPSAIDPEDPELLQDMVTAAVNEALRAAQELAGDEAGRGHRRARRPRRPRAPRHVAVSLRLVRPAGPAPRSPSWASCPGIGARTAQRLAFHLLRADDERGARAGRRDPRGQGEDRAVRGLLQPRRRAALPDLPGRAARRRAHLRRRGARRRHPDRAHARVPRPLPRARRRAVADRRRRPRGPQARRAATRVANAPTRRCARSCSPPTRRRPARRRRSTSPTRLRERAPEVAVTRLASGLPVGADLEYADEVTLGRAFGGRRAL